MFPSVTAERRSRKCLFRTAPTAAVKVSASAPGCSNCFVVQAVSIQVLLPPSPECLEGRPASHAHEETKILSNTLVEPGWVCCLPCVPPMVPSGWKTYSILVQKCAGVRALFPSGSCTNGSATFTLNLLFKNRV